MIKKLIPYLLLIVLLLTTPLVVTEVDAQVASATESIPQVQEISSSRTEAKPIVEKKPVVKKVTPKKKTTPKKKVSKRKEKLTVAPALFTLDTAPHSPAPASKAKSKSKKKKA